MWIVAGVLDKSSELQVSLRQEMELEIERKS